MNCDRKIMQPIRITAYHEMEEVEPVHPVQTSIYKSNTFRKDLSKPAIF